MTRNRVFAVLGAVLVVAGLVAVRHKRVVEKDRAPVLAELAPAVQVAVVRRGTLESVDHVLGEVLGAEEAEIAPRLSGEVREVLVREGDRVTRGAVLARLDTQELDDAVAAAEAEVEAARVAHEAQAASTSRDSVLFENHAISQEQWEHTQAARSAAVARFEVARRRLAQARARVGYAVARAPFDGVVSARMVDPGDLAVPGRPMLRVVRQSSVRVRGALPPALLTKVRRGTPVDLTLGDEHVHAVVSRVFPAMQGSHLATFEVDLSTPPSDFVAGGTVGVDLHVENGEGLLVPLDALLEGSAGAHAFVVDGGASGTDTLHVLAVTVTTRSLDEAIVEGDLSEGDQVVVARPSRLMGLSAGMSVLPVADAPGR
ncbi:MAG: efflux RND transporter periplasmic adaptor subunit [Gemmatimonadota bacterium]|jgi:RND family efflux transporter MFP subunit